MSKTAAEHFDDSLQDLLQEAFRECGIKSSPGKPVYKLPPPQTLQFEHDNFFKVAGMKYMTILALHLGSTIDGTGGQDIRSQVWARSDGTIIQEHEHGYQVIDPDNTHVCKITYDEQLHWPQHLLDNDGLENAAALRQGLWRTSISCASRGTRNLLIERASRNRICVNWA